MFSSKGKPSCYRTGIWGNKLFRIYVVDRDNEWERLRCRDLISLRYLFPVDLYFIEGSRGLPKYIQQKLATLVLELSNTDDVLLKDLDFQYPYLYCGSWERRARNSEFVAVAAHEGTR